MARVVFKQVSKRFPGVQALTEVSLEIPSGSCQALIGENGAGKSTLGKILAGVHTADEGELWLDDDRIAPASPLEARRLGIAMVHQELAFCPNLSIAENLCLGELPTNRAGWLNQTQMRDEARRMLTEVGADFAVDQPVSTLSTAQEQVLQIAAAVGTGARVIVMDEPTSSLSAREAGQLFELIGHLKQRGITLIYVSHRMEEIFRLCDRVSVLRDGRHIATEPIAETSPERIVRQMVGREVEDFVPQHVQGAVGTEVLRVEGLSSRGKFQGINFQVHAGEVVGLAGLVGAGRSEIASAIFGLDAAANGKVLIEGRELPLGDVREALAAGIGFLPEDRKRFGLVLSMDCRENGSLAILPRLTRAGLVDRTRERELIDTLCQRMKVKAPNLEVLVAGLSGGNQQKVALAKWLALEGRVLIVDEPTRGVDVVAKAEIHTMLDELAARGMAILLISSELPELMKLSRRILVIRAGELAGEVARSEFSESHLMRLMAGVAQQVA